MQIRYIVHDSERLTQLEGDAEIRVGRGADCDIVLPDFSVSRQHAAFRRQERQWWIVDLGSTNGLEVNGVRVASAACRIGDQIKVGMFELFIEEQAAAEIALANATIVRPLTQFQNELGVLPAETSVETRSDRGFFTYMTRLARELIEANTVDGVLRRVMDIAFEALPIDRGFILLGSPEDAVCELARIGDEVNSRPSMSDVPVSRTILSTVLEQRVALLTLDALDDQRLMGGESIRIHGIRSAMCTPLWSEDRLSGFMQVDSPIQAGNFSEQDLDFLIALSNYAAVGVERVRERQVRGRLERYHSPSVMDEVMAVAGGDDEGLGIRRADVTVLFADLVGFTAFSESSEPEQVAELLGGYCTRAVKAIFDHGGTLDKFIGDCVMAFFGAPVEQEDHAIRGLEAAIAIQDAMDSWNEERREAGESEVQCRVAVHSGPVVVGDVGSESRVDYTVLGNTVNVAARLESNVAKPGGVVAGDATIEQLRQSEDPTLGGRVAIEELGQFTLKGLQKPVEAFRVVRSQAGRES